jgi:signal transduction histidine kinase
MGPATLAHLRNPPLAPLSQAIARGAPQQDVFAVVLTLCIVALLAFSVAVLRLTSKDGPSRGVLVACLMLQMLLALAISQRWLFVVSAELSLLLPARQAWRWWLAQAACYLASRWLCATTVHSLLLSCSLAGPSVPLPPSGQVLMQTMLDAMIALLFQGLAFAIGALARAEQRRRAELALAHRDLLATRRLIGQASATQERLRVSRELHDSIGHQLTAMKLHIDLAMRQAESTESLRVAAQLSQALLTEVRAVVRAERAGAPGPQDDEAAR